VVVSAGGARAGGGAGGGAGGEAGGGAGGPLITPGAHWQQEELAASFAERRRILIPLLELQEDVVAHLFSRSEHPVKRFLDVGPHPGPMTELMLGGGVAGSEASAVLVDFSQPMLARAGVNLAEHAGRWEAVAGDLNSPSWRDALPGGRYDAVVSGLAIHHLPQERKPALFAEILELLEPGGMFVNMDYVAIDGPLRGLFDEAMHANAVRAASSSERERERENGGTRHRHSSFPASSSASSPEGDGEGDVDLDDDDDDRPDTVEDQLRWLREAGFEQVEVHFKWAEAAIFGGIRPVHRAPCGEKGVTRP
jgi:tRNA (cmo5U34)-methyltransferase